MEWVCPECDRRYDAPPEECVCGGQVVPEGTEGEDDPLSRLAEHVYDVVFEPAKAKRGLLHAGPRVRLAFRILVGLSLALGAAAAVSLLL